MPLQFFHGQRACFHGCRKDLRDGKIGAHRMVGPLRHRFRNRDEGMLGPSMDHALRIENAVLECLAEFRRGGLVLSRQPFADTAKEL